MSKNEYADMMCLSEFYKVRYCRFRQKMSERVYVRNAGVE